MLESEQKAIVANLLVNPYDKAALGAYADWLEEQGQEFQAQEFRRLGGFVFDMRLLHILKKAKPLFEDGKLGVMSLIPGVFNELRVTLYRFRTEARILFATQPITKVVLIDRVPARDEGVFIVLAEDEDRDEWEDDGEEWEEECDDEYGDYWPADRYGEDYFLPKWLFDLVKKREQIKTADEEVASFKSIKRYKRIVSDSCVAYGRALAGLPPLTELNHYA